MSSRSGEMNEQDLAKLRQFAQGEGEMRVGKLLMRTLLSGYACAQSGRPISATAERASGSQDA